MAYYLRVYQKRVIENDMKIEVNFCAKRFGKPCSFFRAYSFQESGEEPYILSMKNKLLSIKMSCHSSHLVIPVIPCHHNLVVSDLGA